MFTGTSSASLQQLLEWFVETQMFEVFITKQIEKTDWGSTIGMCHYVIVLSLVITYFMTFLSQSHPVMYRNI